MQVIVHDEDFESCVIPTVSDMRRKFPDRVEEPFGPLVNQDGIRLGRGRFTYASQSAALQGKLDDGACLRWTSRDPKGRAWMGVGKPVVMPKTR